jgi:hypothetical protein
MFSQTCAAGSQASEIIAQTKETISQAWEIIS